MKQSTIHDIPFIPSVEIRQPVKRQFLKKLHIIAFSAQMRKNQIVGMFRQKFGKRIKSVVVAEMPVPSDDPALELNRTR